MFNRNLVNFFKNQLIVFSRWLDSSVDDRKISIELFPKVKEPEVLKELSSLSQVEDELSRSSDIPSEGSSTLYWINIGSYQLSFSGSFRVS